MRFFRAWLLLFAALEVFAAGDADSPKSRLMGRTPEQIRKSGVLRVGVHNDIPKIAYADPETGEYAGFEIEVAKMLGRDILSSGKRRSRVQFLPVKADTRESMLDAGDIDIIIATYSTLEENAEYYNLSPPYYLDYAGFLTRKDSDIKSMRDMNGKSIGVIKYSSTRKIVEEETALHGVYPRFYEFSRFSEIKAALASGLLDIFAADKVILSRYVDEDTVVLEENFAPREYCIVTKLSALDLAAFITHWVLQRRRENVFRSLMTYFNLEKTPQGDYGESAPLPDPAAASTEPGASRITGSAPQNAPSTTPK